MSKLNEGRKAAACQEIDAYLKIGFSTPERGEATVAPPALTRCWLSLQYKISVIFA